MRFYMLRVCVCVCVRNQGAHGTRNFQEFSRQHGEVNDPCFQRCCQRCTMLHLFASVPWALLSDTAGPRRHFGRSLRAPRPSGGSLRKEVLWAAGTRIPSVKPDAPKKTPKCLKTALVSWFRPLSRLHTGKLVMTRSCV